MAHSLLLLYLGADQPNEKEDNAMAKRDKDNGNLDIAPAADGGRGKVESRSKRNLHAIGTTSPTQ